MSKKTNEELFIQYKHETDTYKKEQILNALFKQNKNFTHHIAKKFKNSKLAYDEIVNLATIGMVKAIKTYNPEHSKFITYSSRLMTNEILMELRKAEYKKDLISIETPTAENLTIGDMISDGNDFEIKLTRKDLINNILQYASKSLSEKEKVILANELSDNPKTQKELGDELGCAQSYVSRLQKKIIFKLKDYLVEVKTIY